MKKLSIEVKEHILPIQTYQVSLLGERIQHFQSNAKKFRHKFKELPFFEIDCKNVYQKCNAEHKTLSHLELELENLIRSTELFCITKPTASKLKICRKEIKLVKVSEQYYN